VGDANNLLVGTTAGGSDGTGLFWAGVTGTTAPTDSTTALNAGFKNAGLITEDGLTIGFNETTKKIKAYGSTATQRVLITDAEYTFKVKFLETNPTSQALFWRRTIGSISPTVSTGTFSVTAGTSTRNLFTLVADVIDTTNNTNHLRFYAPSAEVTDRDDISVSNGNEIGWGVTITCYPVAGIAVAMYAAIPNLG
jgi:hypothetical protein